MEQNWPPQMWDRISPQNNLGGLGSIDIDLDEVTDKYQAKSSILRTLYYSYKVLHNFFTGFFPTPIQICYWAPYRPAF